MRATSISSCKPSSGTNRKIIEEKNIYKHKKVTNISSVQCT